MPITQVGTPTTGTGSGSPHAVTLPTGWAAGDLAIIFIAGLNQGSTPTYAATGWTASSVLWTSANPTKEDISFLYRVLQAGDTGPSVTGGGKADWVCVVLRGADQTNPIEESHSQNNSTSSASASFAGLSPAEAGDFVFTAYTEASLPSSGRVPPPGQAELAVSSTNAVIVVNGGMLFNSNATGTMTATIGNTTTTNSYSVLVKTADPPPPITLVGSQIGSQGTGTSLTVNLPSGSQKGDVGIIFISDNSTSAVSATGWTASTVAGGTGSANVSYLYRVFDGTEGSTVTVTVGSGRVDYGAMVWRGVDNGTPLDDHQSTTASSAGTLNLATATATVLGDILLAGIANTTNTIAPTVPGDTTELIRAQAQTNPMLQVLAKQLSAVGSTGTISETWSNNQAALSEWTVLLKANAEANNLKPTNVQQAVQRAATR